MNAREHLYHRRATYISGFFHLLIIILLSYSFNIQTAAPIATSTSLVSIQAVSVNQENVQNEINKIKQEQATKKQQEINRQKELKRLEKKAVQQRIQAQKQVAKLKADAAKLQAQQKQIEDAAAEKLQMIKQQQSSAQTQLETLKKQQELLKQKPKPVPAQPNTPVNKPVVNPDEEKQLQQKIAEEEQNLSNINQQMLASELEKYKALILNAIGRQWIMPANVNKNLSAQFQINLDSTGKVLSVQLLRSSGDPLLDSSVQLAIQKASPLPVPTSPDLYSNFKELRLTVRPEGLMVGNL